MKALSIVLASLLLCTTSTAQSDACARGTRPALTHYNLSKKLLAIEGYDPVAYFPEGGGKAAEGKAALSITHRGVSYRFSTAKNLELFKARPERFEPSYGGWCAFAMARDKKVEINPEYFLIQNDRLLLFFKGFFNNTRKKWSEGDTAASEVQANRNWKRISGEGAARDTRHFNLENGLALKGFDPVSYFTLKGARPIEGSSSLETTHKDVTYRSATVENRQALSADPERFEPRYGGYCGWAMSQGKKVDVDPAAYVVEEVGLTLFYNTSKRDEWIRGGAEMQRAADRHWKKLHAAR